MWRFRAILAFGCCALLARAADRPNPRVTGTPLLSVWRPEQYHAAPVNWRVLQHPATGFIYVANNFGVLEFDGSTWRLIPLPRGGPVRSIVVDSRGTLWAGGQGELCTLEPDSVGTLRAVDQAWRVPDYSGPGEAEDADNDDSTLDPHRVGLVVRAAAGDDGVYFRLPGRIVRFALDRSVTVWPMAMPLGQIWWLNGALHLNSVARGIERLESDGARAITTVRGASVIAAAITPATAPGTSGPWHLLTTRGPTRWAGGDATPDPIRPENFALFADDAATGAIFVPDGRAVYSTTRNGMRVFDADGHAIQQVDRASGLPGDRVNGLCYDRDGGVWLAMHFAIARVQIGGPFAVHGPAQGMDGGPRDFLRARGRLFVTHGEGMSWRDDATGQFQLVEGIRGGTHHAILAGDRLVVAGTSAMEVTTAGSVRVLRDSTHYALHPAPGGAVLASTALNVWLWPAINRAAERVAVSTLPAGANQLIESADGAIWTVLRNGEVWRMAAQDGISPTTPARRYLPDPAFATMRPRDGLHLLRVDGDLLAASAQWLLRYMPAQDRFVVETRLGARTAARGPIAACETREGGAWFYFDGEDAHFARVTPRPDSTWQQQTFSARALGDLAINALFHDETNDTLWIAGQGALLSFNPRDAEPANPRPLRAVVYDVADDSGKILWSNQAKASVIAPIVSLPAAETAVRLHFATAAYAPNYRGQLVTEFRTRLEPLDAKWTTWSAEERRDFTNLPPGDLALQLQARDGSGRVSDVTTFRVKLATPWWRTPWAIVGYFFGLSAGVVGFVKIRTKALRAHNTRLEKVVTLRTAELQERNGELTRLHRLELDEKISARLGEEKARLEILRYQLNPHFLFNALNAFPGLVAQQPATASAMALSLGEFCRRMLTQAGEGWQPVQEEFAMLEAYLQVEKIRWGESLHVEVTLDPALRAVPIPAFLLLPLVENAIKHGGASSPDVLQIRLNGRLDGDSLEFAVENSGRWSPIPAPGVVSTSIGLENIRRRLNRYYPGAHAFTIGAGGLGVVAHLRLPRQPPNQKNSSVADVAAI